MFEVGQKVTLVEPESEGYPPPHPQFGAVYTVSEAFIDDGDAMIQLAEIPFDGGWFNARGNGLELWDRGYLARFFRPVVEPKTGIAVFEAMLYRAPADARKHLHELEEAR